MAARNSGGNSTGNSAQRCLTDTGWAHATLPIVCCRKLRGLLLPEDGGFPNRPFPPFPPDWLGVDKDGGAFLPKSTGRSCIQS